jgi:hypothetical protein
VTKISSATGPIPSATGRCLCGAVRFTATEVDPHMHVCHCGMCRRHAGGPTLSVSVGGITFQGEDNILRYKSSDYAERGTCNKCGGHLFYHLFSPDMYIMSIGAFDDQSRFTIGGEIFIDNKPAGYAFAGNHPRETEHEFLKRIGAIS